MSKNKVTFAEAVNNFAEALEPRTSFRRRDSLKHNIRILRHNTLTRIWGETQQKDLIDMYERYRSLDWKTYAAQGAIMLCFVVAAFSTGAPTSMRAAIGLLPPVILYGLYRSFRTEQAKIINHLREQIWDIRYRDYV